MIDIWDTAGQEAYDNIHPTYYFEANSALLVFDTTRKITYKNCMKCIMSLELIVLAHHVF